MTDKQREAQRLANKKWRDANKEKQALSHKKWREKNKDYYKEYFKDDDKLNNRRHLMKAYKDKCTKNDFYTIYKIQIDNNIYIGQTIKKLRIRKSEHKRNCLKSETLLYTWLITIEDFNLEEITTVKTKEEALLLEAFYIEEYKKLNFNIFNTYKTK